LSFIWWTKVENSTNESVTTKKRVSHYLVISRYYTVALAAFAKSTYLGFIRWFTSTNPEASQNNIIDLLY
jgi:hypothetical protein